MVLDLGPMQKNRLGCKGLPGTNEMKNMAIEFNSLLLTMAASQIKFF
jgi:hypothetical protein